jgi:hypothetical protein
VEALVQDFAVAIQSILVCAPSAQVRLVTTELALLPAQVVSVR